jgi:hypothetical protein
MNKFNPKWTPLDRDEQPTATDDSVKWTPISQGGKRGDPHDICTDGKNCIFVGASKETVQDICDAHNAVLAHARSQLLQALAAIAAKNAKLMELIQFHISGDPCHVLETVELNPDLSTLDKHDEELKEEIATWKDKYTRLAIHKTTF